MSTHISIATYFNTSKWLLTSSVVGLEQLWRWQAVQVLPPGRFEDWHCQAKSEASLELNEASHDVLSYNLYVTYVYD